MKHDQSCPAFTSGRECDCNYREAPAKLPTISPNDGEREAFEAAYRERHRVPSHRPLTFPDVPKAWEWWQARATLAAASPDGAGVPVAWRAWFDQDNGARWLFTLWPEEERLDVTWQPLYAAPQAQPEPSDAGLDVLDEVSMFDRIQAARFSKPSTPQPEPSVQPPAEATNRPSKEWYRRKIAEVGDADVMVGPAFQPPAEASEPFGYVVYDNLMGWRFHKEKPDGISANSRLHTVFATPQPPAPVVPWARAIAQEERACRAEDVLIDLVNQIRKTSPVDDHGHVLTLNMAYLKAVELLDSGADNQTIDHLDKAIGALTPQPPAPVVPLTEVGNGHADYCEALKYEGSECSCSGVSVPATVPLTTERIDAIWHGMGSFTSNDHRIFARAIEAAHKIGDKP